MERASLTRQFELENNIFKYQTNGNKTYEGMELSDEQQKFLLPSFLMLIVGKPGSGKTAAVKQLLQNSSMYKQKFDHIYIASPSHMKLGIKVKPQNATNIFSLEWVFTKIEEVNRKQILKINSKSKHEFIQNTQPNATKNIQAQFSNKLITPDIFTRPYTAAGMKTSVSGLGKSSAPILSDEMQNQLIKKQAQLPMEEQKENHVNVLFIFDDVIGDIKKQENNPSLAQLVMNRRHLILAGTISVIIISQKYTLIPSRIRSNANWLILFKLNPNDFDLVKKDAITTDDHTWNQLLDFVFDNDRDDQEDMSIATGGRAKSKTSTVNDNNNNKSNREEMKGMSRYEKLGRKRYDNLGIWVEFNVYFKNFKRVMLN